MDEPLARTAVFNGKLVAIDTELGRLLEAPDCLVHCDFGEFLAGILSSAKEKGEGCVVPLPVRDDTQTEVGDGTTSITEQEARSDCKSLNSAFANSLLTRYSAYSIFQQVSKFLAPVSNPFYDQLAITIVTSKSMCSSNSVTA